MVIGYGEVGGAELKIIEQKGFKSKHIPMQRGNTKLF